MTTQARTMTATFEIGKTYVMTFIGDSDLKVRFKCISRTEKFATFEDARTKEQMRRKINNYSDCESVREGNYSMAPSIYADSVIEEKKETIILKPGDTIEANKLVMVITGETEKAFMGYIQYKGKPVGQCSLLKEMLSNPHYMNGIKKI